MTDSLHVYAIGGHGTIQIEGEVSFDYGDLGEVDRCRLGTRATV